MMGRRARDDPARSAATAKPDAVSLGFQASLQVSSEVDRQGSILHRLGLSQIYLLAWNYYVLCNVVISAAIPHIYSAYSMEQFALSAQHAGSINHVHSFHFSSSALDLAREVRSIVLIAVVGWVTVTGIRGVLTARRPTE